MGNTKKGWMLLAIYIATFMTAIESTIVVTVANAISKSFAGDVPISLLFSSYLFSSALATPILSRLADQYGKKQVFYSDFSCLSSEFFYAAFRRPFLC